MTHHNACTYHKYQKYPNGAGGAHCDKEGRRGGICFSLLLITIGILFLLDYLGMLGGHEVVQFWPLALMLPALSGLFRARYWTGRIFAIVVLLFADLALVHNLQLFAVPWGLIWPAFIVILGASIMAMVALFPRKKAHPLEIPETFLNSDEMLSTHIVCGGKEDDFGTSEFKGGVVDVFMGGYELDLRSARMESDTAELYVRVKLAGVKILVPQNWEVKVEGDTFMGTIEDHSSNRSVEVEKQFIIHAFVRQGAIEVNN